MFSIPRYELPAEEHKKRSELNVKAGDEFKSSVKDFPEELLEKLHEIEKEAHRERIIRWGPRTLDLDILLYDDLVMENDELIIPHIEMHMRDFVLKPLSEIAPNVRHPIYKKTISQLLKELG